MECLVRSDLTDVLTEFYHLAAGSEDNTARIWNASGECLQVIPHPGCVWSVAFTGAGDVVSGCSDYVAYVWSADTQRQATPEAQAQLTDTIAERAAMAAKPTGAYCVQSVQS